ncbi:MAG: phosphotransferase [Alphaproteobacteria bacterium]|uniref:Phosphotransferase n=1 Tax=Candidatus Nitrobium versatile TaxID=2884831 RepID=A0A953LW35_9BACT|nr:phosphotransferase [Candidatus Nitrobium versatile]
MILEIHCHTAEHSVCSKVSAAELVQRNFEKGLQGTVFTEHQYLWPPEEIRELRMKLKVPDYYVVLSGQEVATSDFGHVLVYGADVVIEKGTSIKTIRERFPEAALVWAHPYRDENIPPREMLLHPLIDGVEIFNANHTVTESARALRDWHHHKFTAIAGTDSHALSYAGIYPTFFDHPVATIEELALEIRAGRCRPFFKEIPRSGTSDTQITEITIGTKGGGVPLERYMIKSHENGRAFMPASGIMHIMDEFVRRGFEKGAFRIPKPLGFDQKSLTVIEQDIQGETLFDKLLHATPDEAALYLRMTAEWLAKLHNLRLQITPPEEFLQEEVKRMEHDLASFYKTNNPHARRAEEIMNTVVETESALFCKYPERMVQGHGDFHPKNIIIGQDDPADPSSIFVAAIDFGSSYTLPPAFDIGTFLAQFRNQFHNERQVLSKVSEDVFLQAYLIEACNLDNDFLPQVEFFIARTSLSISYYLIKVGLGTSENIWRVLIEAGHSLARLAVHMKGWPIIEYTDASLNR